MWMLPLYLHVNQKSDDDDDDDDDDEGEQVAFIRNVIFIRIILT